jgi:repressor LexA
MNITNKQKFVLDSIKRFYQENRHFPTLKEIQGYIGYNSISSVQRHTDNLKENGYLIDDNKKGLKPFKKFLDQYVQIPLVGDVACGNPTEAIENIEAYIPYKRTKLKGSLQNHFFLKATGDSMDKSNIKNGDYLLIKRSIQPAMNTIVLALIGNEATIKKIKKENNHYILEPNSTNKKHKKIVLFEDLMIQGVVQDIIKN